MVMYFAPKSMSMPSNGNVFSPEKVSTLDKPVAFFEPEPISSCFGDLLFVDGFISESRIDI